MSASSFRTDTPGGEPPRIWPVHVDGPVEPFEDPDQAGSRIKLTPQHAVAGARRIGAMGTVPAPAKRDNGPGVGGTGAFLAAAEDGVAYLIPAVTPDKLRAGRE